MSESLGEDNPRPPTSWGQGGGSWSSLIYMEAVGPTLPSPEVTGKGLQSPGCIALGRGRRGETRKEGR